MSVDGRRVLRPLQSYFQLVNTSTDALCRTSSWIHLRRNKRPVVEDLDNHVHVIITYHVEQIFRNRLIRSTRGEGRV